VNDSEESEDYPVVMRHSLKPRVKLCPKCLSPVKQVSSFGGWLIPEIYDCESCGYRGSIAFEMSDKAGSSDKTEDPGKD
jgi:hypothetical protein